MRAVIFAGPSLPPSVRPSAVMVEWRPPVQQGDLYRAARERPAIIGVVDGYFERVPTVWHKEILWAMAEGIHVYGAASIGALRAAELADFGMHGVGRVYEQFRTGACVDDEEVAVLHGPVELDYVQITMAMVNVRATLDRAADLGVIDCRVAGALCDSAKALFYKDRTYEDLLRLAAARGLATEALSRFANWLPHGQVDQKRLDAEEMLRTIMGQLAGGVPLMRVTYKFARTFAWEEARRGQEAVEAIVRCEGIPPVQMT